MSPSRLGLSWEGGSFGDSVWLLAVGLPERQRMNIVSSHGGHQVLCPCTSQVFMPEDRDGGSSQKVERPNWGEPERAPIVVYGSTCIDRPTGRSTDRQRRSDSIT